MIEINHNTTIGNKYKRYVNSYMKYEVYLDLETILKDLEKLDTIGEKTENSIVKKNVKNITKYLMGITKLCKNDGNSVSIYHKWNGEYLDAYPFEIRKLPRYGIDAINYFKVSDCKILELDYSELINALCFECMYRDLGYSDEFIEEKLSGVGLYGIHSSGNLDFIAKDSYAKGMKLKITDSPMYDVNTHKMYSYFGEQVNSKDYSGVVERNATVALNSICCQLLEKVDGEHNITVWRVDDGVITVCVKGEVEEFQEFLNGVNCQLFGRQFKFNSKKSIINIKSYTSSDNF